MNVYKFGVKPKATHPKTVHWRPLQDVKYQPRKIKTVTWEIFMQENITLKPNEVKEIFLVL